MIALTVRGTKKLHCVYAVCSHLQVAFTFYVKSFVQLENLCILFCFFSLFCVFLHKWQKQQTARRRRASQHLISTSHTYTHEAVSLALVCPWKILLVRRSLRHCFPLLRANLLANEIKCILWQPFNWIIIVFAQQSCVCVCILPELWAKKTPTALPTLSTRCSLLLLRWSKTKIKYT